MYSVSSFITTDKGPASYENRLSICLTTSGFSFSVISQKDLLLSFGDIGLDMAQPISLLVADIKACFADHAIYPVDFKSMELVVPSDVYAWIPAQLFVSESQNSYLESVAALPRDAYVLSSRHSALDAIHLFTAPRQVVTAFKLAMPGIDVKSVPFKLLSDDLLQRSASHPVLLASVAAGKGKDAFDVDYIAAVEGRLLLSTRRSVSDADALCRSAVTVMKLMEIERLDMEMLLCGEVDRAIFMALRDYFPNIDLYNGQRHRFLNPRFQQLHTYRYVVVL